MYYPNMNHLWLWFQAIVMIIVIAKKSESKYPDDIHDDNEEGIMFWRPQKVGSSTLLSILVSYAFRNDLLARRKEFQSSLCKHIAYTALNDNSTKVRSFMDKKKLRDIVQFPTRRGNFEDARQSTFQMCYTHELCGFNSDLIGHYIPLLFKSKRLHEIFIVREPIGRALSVYYFWGELFKLNRNMDQEFSKPKNPMLNKKGGNFVQPPKMIGQKSEVREVRGKFLYHGDETTVPPHYIAMEYAETLFYNRGMPGPSLTWSAFAQNVQESVKVLESRRVIALVTERLDESLIVMAEHMHWSIADIVIVKYRKALSSHPKAKDWPKEVIQSLNRTLTNNHEVHYYQQANRILDERITELKASGYEFDESLETLKKLRDKASELCLSKAYLERYRHFLEALNVPKNRNTNKLRDVEMEYVSDGHAFSLNGELLYSFDVCGSCESHAFLLALKMGLAKNIESSLSLSQLSNDLKVGNKVFAHCPI